MPAPPTVLQAFTIQERRKVLVSFSVNVGVFVILFINTNNINLSLQKLLSTTLFPNSVTSFTISYRDFFSDLSCCHEVIPASFCVNGSCSHICDIKYKCFNSSIVTVTLFTSSIYGDGRESTPYFVIIGKSTS